MLLLQGLLPKWEEIFGKRRHRRPPEANHPPKKGESRAGTHSLSLMLFSLPWCSCWWSGLCGGWRSEAAGVGREMWGKSIQQQPNQQEQGAAAAVWAPIFDSQSKAGHLSCSFNQKAEKERCSHLKIVIVNLPVVGVVLGVIDFVQQLNC